MSSKGIPLEIHDFFKKVTPLDFRYPQQGGNGIFLEKPNCRTNSIETTEHFLMHCSDYSNERSVMFDSLQQHGINLVPLNPINLFSTLLYGNLKFDAVQNHTILSITVKFICATGRFDGPLF